MVLTQKQSLQLIVAVVFVSNAIDHADYVSSKQTTDNSAHNTDNKFHKCSHDIFIPPFTEGYLYEQNIAALT